MTTTVQLRPIAAADCPRCDLLHGVPLELVAGEFGPVALFAPGALVAYRVRSRRRVSLYMFRTLDVADPRAASVPGVRPRVQLLLDLHSAGRVRIVRGLFAHLTSGGRDPSLVSDAFHLRVGVAIAGRLPAHKIALSLLHRESCTTSLPRTAPTSLAP